MHANRVKEKTSMPLNLEPTDIGNGKTLKFQRRTATGEIRAVIADKDGDIVFRGCITPETLAGVTRTRMDVCAQMQAITKTYADSSDFDEEEEKEEEEDEE
jgi:hypothetical protein